ncbi:MAG TPA: TonB-dependent receptor [candidate division Zixibacteria bacterium]|nr:TonB-dependent receptor [candidate division Zixibacteria bacterium]
MTRYSGSYPLLTAAIIALTLATATGVIAGDLIGTISGRVVDASTRAPLPGASISVIETKLGAVADESGEFTIKRVPVGGYTVRVNSLGYTPLSQPDVIVRSGRITRIEMELKPTLIVIEGVAVSSGYFIEQDDQPASTAEFSGEEIRRAPGSAGDVSRIIGALPSIAKTDDQVNALAVRGGNPSENGFYLDNIEIPNINHFPREGTSVGSLSLINVDLIRDVKFSAGGFPSGFGNRLSSIMELSFREGNREEFDGQASFDLIGLGAVAEGPFPGGKGSWLVSTRKSYLDLLVDIASIELAPEVNDYQGKIVYDLSPAHSLSLVGLAGVSIMDYTREQAVKDGNSNYAVTDNNNYTFGLNWRYRWSQQGYSNSSISLQRVKYGSEAYRTATDSLLQINRSFEHQANLRNSSFYNISERAQIEFGGDVTYLYDDFDYFANPGVNALGEPVSSIDIQKELTATYLGAFASMILHPGSKLTTTIGLRYDRNDCGDHTHLSPRLSASFDLTDRTSLFTAVGLYYQPLTPLVLVQNEEAAKLEEPQARHYIIGWRHLLAEDTRLTVESYYKDYRRLTMDTSLPQFLVLDADNAEFSAETYEYLTDRGRAKSYGFEATLQKKLAHGIYGLLGFSLSHSEYRDLRGVWRNRVFDNRFIFSAEGGYKPNKHWEFSARWIIAGGRPYTPLNLTESAAQNRTVLDEFHVNESRYPAYHSLNLRVDHRYYFSGSNLVIYLSLWNAYNHKNIAAYYWNELEHKPDEVTQWGLMPILGIEWEL